MNSTIETDSWSWSTGQAPNLFAELKPFIPTYTHLLVSALLPIYAGAHASLSRPSTAAKPPKKSRSLDASLDEDDDDEPIVQRMEGMTLSDAILFPVIAGIVLTSLYFLIKWLEDPAILNTILIWYFAAFSIFSVARLVSDSLDVLHSTAFPRQYVDTGVVWNVQTLQRRVVPQTSTSTSSSPLERNTPLPGPFAHLPLPTPLLNLAWFLKAAPNRKFTFKLHSHRTFTTSLKLGIHGIEGLTIGLLTVLYYNIVSKPWPLTNLLGLSFAYGSLQLLSPTKFTIGTLLLAALFVYDVYMVFFTPMMVSVATKLEIPAKLEFPRPDVEGIGRGLAMLGLGDVVLPGMFCGLALRFDLWMHYLRMQRRVEPEHVDTDGDAQEDGRAYEVVKAPYQNVTGYWGDRLWMSRFVASITGSRGQTTSTNPSTKSQLASYAFPKPYFTATIIGYVIGMLSTLLAMQLTDHPQPALLYLVPGVVGSVWLTGVFRRELREMLAFSDEDETEEEKKKEGEQAKREKKAQDKWGWELWSSHLGGLLGIEGTQKEAPKKGKEKAKNDGDTKRQKAEITGRTLIDVNLGGVFGFVVLLPPPLNMKEVQNEGKKRA